MQLFLDCDGVLADFDRGAERVLGMPPRQFEKRHGLPAFWKRLAKAGDFYARLPLMPDARRLFNAVRHLDPIILTGCPRGGWAEAQKERWAEQHFPGARIITCMAVDKRRHALAETYWWTTRCGTGICGRKPAAPSYITTTRMIRFGNSLRWACRFISK